MCFQGNQKGRGVCFLANQEGSGVCVAAHSPYFPAGGVWKRYRASAGGRQAVSQSDDNLAALSDEFTGLRAAELVNLA